MALPGTSVAQSIGVAAAVVGEVQIVVPGELPRAIASGDEIRAGDRVVTGPGSGVQLLLKDQSAFTLGASSDLAIERFATAGNSALAARTNQGRVRFVAGERPNGSAASVSLRMPGAAVQANSSSFAVAVGPDRTGYVANTGMGRDAALGSRDVVTVAGQAINPGFAANLTATGAVTGIGRIDVAAVTISSRAGAAAMIAPTGSAPRGTAAAQLPVQQNAAALGSLTPVLPGSAVAETVRATTTSAPGAGVPASQPGALPVPAALAVGMPTGGNITLPSAIAMTGSANIASAGQPGPIALTTTSPTVMSWNQFNVGNGTSVTYYQPGSGSVTVDRIGGGQSAILGSIASNGQIVLINTDASFKQIGSPALIDVYVPSGNITASVATGAGTISTGGNVTIGSSLALPAAVVISGGSGGNITMSACPAPSTIPAVTGISMGSGATITATAAKATSAVTAVKP